MGYYELYKQKGKHFKSENSMGGGGSSRPHFNWKGTLLGMWCNKMYCNVFQKWWMPNYLRAFCMRIPLLCGILS